VFVTLTTRVSICFLTALAVVLAGFSTSLFLLARTYLYRQVDERLEAALDTLTASVEEGPEGVEWEPTERHFYLGQNNAADQVRWLVADQQGRVVDRSPNLAANDSLADVAWTLTYGSSAYRESNEQGQARRLAQRRVPEFTSLGPAQPRSTEPALPAKPETRYSALALTAAVSLEPVRATLGKLALALVGLSLSIWSVAAFLGRRFCRRALDPVAQMASAARAMHAAERDRRLPVSACGDELEDLGRAFNDLLTRLQESFERQQRFTGDASHQLRTPLAAMLGQVEVALFRDRAPEEYRRTLTLVQRQALQLRDIVETLLFLARADADAKLPDLESMDVCDWLKHFARSWEANPYENDLRVVDACPDGVRVAGQASMLGQLMHNLLDNARKYGEPGSTITVRIEREVSNALLIVENIGPGISPEDLPHIFEPFYRSPEVRRLGHGGLGLGLAVAHRIASALGGTLVAQSIPGRITQFTLRLPVEVSKNGPEVSIPFLAHAAP
jgi:signal transduction histidine kinase